MATDQTRVPFINAPLVVTAAALTIGCAHVARILAPERLQTLAIYHGALFPERFWSWAGGEGAVGGIPGYTSAAEALLPLVTSGFLHADFMHVVLNALFLLALGKPLYTMFLAASDGRRGRAAVLFVGLALLSQAVGGLVFLALQGPDGSLAIGSSGGVSGLLGAVLLVFTRAGGRLFGRPFLTATAIFVIANAILAVVGPSLLGASIAWEAHVGGFIAGSVVMRIWLQASAGRLKR